MLDPVIPSFSGDDPPGARFTPGGYHSFEHRWAVREAFDLHRRIGRGRIAERIAIQATRLKKGLATILSVTLVASVTPYEQQYLRFGPSIVTTPAQMDRVVDAVRRLRP